MEQAVTVQRAAGGRPETSRVTAGARHKGLLKRMALGTLVVLGLAAAAEYGAE
jgi:hypothetical protein